MNGAEGVWPPVSLHGGHTTAADGAASASEMIASARDKGMEVFGLSEHFYRPREGRYRYESEGMGLDWGRARWPAFVDGVLEARERLGDGGPRVLLGAEVEFLPGQEEWTLEQLARWPLDYTVLSVHFVEIDGETFPFDYSKEAWDAAARRAGGVVPLFRVYYEHVLEALSWKVGDVLGHLDIIKIHAGAAVEDAGIDALIDRVLDQCAAREVVLDLNARGLLKPCAEVYPSRAILRRAAARGVGIVPGDDSHHPDQVGLGFDRASAWALAAGYDRVALPARLGGDVWPLRRG